MKLNTFRLPSGKYTTSVRRYVSAWKRLNEPLEKLFGRRCYAFDPDLAFEGAFTIPVTCAIKVWELCVGKEWTE